ncbi:MAG TPA: hypothetical protein VKQ54_05765 [Caulobacteraceae bacterium]|nr:hypothetical protein [Caulobacteraceae bacterium]
MIMGRMISNRLGRSAAGVVAALATLTGAASAASAADTNGRSCFTVNNWHGWSSPSPDVLYLAVNFRDVYKATLAHPVAGLNLMDTVVISDETGLQSICSAVDLHLTMTHRRGGSRQGLIVRSLTRLTPEEIAAIPKRDRPN